MSWSPPDTGHAQQHHEHRVLFPQPAQEGIELSFFLLVPQLSLPITPRSSAVAAAIAPPAQCIPVTLNQRAMRIRMLRLIALADRDR